MSASQTSIEPKTVVATEETSSTRATTENTGKLSLALALSRNSAAVLDTQGAYQQDVTNVCAQMSLVMASTLPYLNTLPADWDAVTTAYQQARKDALAWTNQVYAQLQETPEDVERYNDVISKVLDDAITQAQALITNPNDSFANMSLKADLKTLSSKFSLINTFIISCQDAFKEFGYTILPDAAAQLSTVANDAYQDQKLDEAKIAEYKKQIEALNQEITALAVEIGLNSAAIATEATMGAVTAAETGGISLICAGVMIAASATVIALDAIKLEKDKAQLTTLHAELDSTSQDAASLQNVGDTYKKLAADTGALSTSVDGISTAWTALESDMNTAIADLNSAMTDAAFNDYQAVYNDLVATQNYWNDVYGDAVSLEINVQGNPAALAIGMTSDQVDAAINANPTVDFVTYINNFPQGSATVAA
ncbi:MAG: hypothetical protein HOP34_12140 [Methylococcaceae bacterium]|nr:hypothetical protein [Methylococcaceae bacterium]